jgi:hypothetical protein
MEARKTRKLFPGTPLLNLILASSLNLAENFPKVLLKLEWIQ